MPQCRAKGAEIPCGKDNSGTSLKTIRKGGGVTSPQLNRIISCRRIPIAFVFRAPLVKGRGLPWTGRSCRGRTSSVMILEGIRNHLGEVEEPTSWSMGKKTYKMVHICRACFQSVVQEGLCSQCCEVVKTLVLFISLQVVFRSGMVFLMVVDNLYFLYFAVALASSRAVIMGKLEQLQVIHQSESNRLGDDWPSSCSAMVLRDLCCFGSCIDW